MMYARGLSRGQTYYCFSCVLSCLKHRASIDVKGRLEHAITGEEIPGWKGKDEVECYIDVDMGDYVVYDDWVGQVRSSSTLRLVHPTDLHLGRRGMHRVISTFLHSY